MADPGPGGAIPPLPRWLVLGGGVLALAGLAVFAGLERQARATRYAGCSVEARVAGGALGGPFELTDQNGARVTDADLLARGPALISFGRAGSDASAALLRRDAAAAAELGARGVQLTPVHIDLGGAGADRLTGIPAGPGRRTVALTGPPARVAALAKAFRLTEPSRASYLVVAGRGTIAAFPAALEPAALAEQAACFIAAAAR